MRRIQPAAADFEDGRRGPGARNCGSLLRKPESKEPDSPLKYLGSNAACPHFGFSLVRPISDF